MDQAAGAKIGPYRIVRKLGEGGMGAVWEATHEGLRKRVAIKTLHASVAQHGEAVARFLREGQAAARIHHPHVVDVTDVGVHEGTPYLVMEYLDGQPLAALIESHGRLAVQTVVAIALPTLDALHAAHLAGIVHRDLKPDNIFLRRSHTGAFDPVVLDFGISKIEGGDARLTKTSSLMGTPYYMSPEQARGAKHIDARSDQFALGLVLYEAVVGKRAVEGESVLEIVHRIAQMEFPRLSTLPTGAPPAFTAVIERMLEGDPNRRFASLKDVGRALLPFADPTTRGVWATVLGDATPAPMPLTSVPPTIIGGSSPPPVPIRASAPGTISQMSRESTATPAPRATPTLGVGLVVVLAMGTGALLLWRPWATPEIVSSPLTPPAVAGPPPALPAPPASTAPATPSTEITLRIGTAPETATVTLDGVDLGPSPVVHAVHRDGVPHVLVVSAAGYIPQRIEFVDIAPVERVELDRVPHGHRGPIVARTAVMTAAGLVPVAPEPAPAAAPAAAPGPAPRPTDVAADEPADEATSDEAAPTRPRVRRATSATRDDGLDDGTSIGANGSVIMR